MRRRKVDCEVHEENSRKGLLIISALDYWSMGLGKGGPALYKTIMGYSQRGWRVYFITGNKPNGMVDDCNNMINVFRFDTAWLKRLMRIRKIGFFARIIWWVYFQIIAFTTAVQRCPKRSIDVVYGYEVDAIPAAKAVSKLWGVPMVSRFQGTSFGVGWHGKRFRNIRAWEHVVGLKMPTDLIIMTDDGTQGDRVLRQLGVDMRKVHFWMNGVDWDAFETRYEGSRIKQELGINNSQIILCISRLVGWKRVDRGIGIMPYVIEKCPKARLLIIGDGQERNKLERLSEELVVKGHVRFMGSVAHSEIPKYLAAADIFLSLYDWSNVGNPLLEAMMAGKCIVTINNGDTGNFIKNRENGVLLEYEDLPKLADIIVGLLNNDELRNRLGTNARKFALERFWSWEERIAAEISTVESIVRRQ